MALPWSWPHQPSFIFTSDSAECGLLEPSPKFSPYILAGAWGRGHRGLLALTQPPGRGHPRACTSAKHWEPGRCPRIGVPLGYPRPEQKCRGPYGTPEMCVHLSLAQGVRPTLRGFVLNGTLP